MPDSEEFIVPDWLRRATPSPAIPASDNPPRGDEDMAKRGRKSAAEKAAGRAERGANTATPEEMDAFFERLHEINDRLDEDSATHRGDMNAVYDEAAVALDMPKEVVAALYKQDRKEQKSAKKFAKADSRTRDAFQRVAQAYGEESPLGQWASRMAQAAGTQAATDKAADAEEGEGK